MRARKRTPVFVEEGSFSPSGEVEHKAEGAPSSSFLSSTAEDAYSSGGVEMLIVCDGRLLDDSEGDWAENVESGDC